jgi:hypothetical protein
MIVAGIKEILSNATKRKIERDKMKVMERWEIMVTRIINIKRL